MAQKSMESKIVLMGEVDASFRQLGREAQKLGNEVSSIGKSVSIASAAVAGAMQNDLDFFMDYDDSYRYVKALGDYTETEMGKISTLARETGRDTRFTAKQSMESLALMEQAGLDYANFLTMLPASTAMASAGQMELDESTQSLISNLYATKTPFEEAMDYVDSLAVVAKESNTDVDGLTKGMARLGAGSRFFKGGYNEALAWMGGLGNLGYEDAEMGTFLRNTMLSLAAPTDRAAEVMEAFGATEEELQSIMEDDATLKQAEAIKELGLNVYDVATGQMRPLVDVFTDFNRLTKDMTEQKRNQLLSAIFPKRTLGAAMGLMDMIDYYNEVTEALENAEGTALRMAETREEGIGGSFRELTSAWEELKLAFAVPLSEDAIQGMDFLRGAILDIAGSDPSTIRTIINALEGVLVAGPATLLVGKGIELFGNKLRELGTANLSPLEKLGTLINPGKAIGLGVALLTGLSLALEMANRQARENEIAEHFGTIGIEAANFTKMLQEMDGGMVDNQKALEDYQSQLESLTDTFSDQASDFSIDIKTAYVFGTKLTSKDEDTLIAMGQSMAETLHKGIALASSESNAFIDMAFGTGSEDAEKYKGLLDEHYSGLAKAVDEFNEELSIEIGLALEDGEITAEEEQKIQAVIDKANRIQAKIQEGMAEGDVYTAISKAQRLGLDGMQEGHDLIQQAIDAFKEDYYAIADETAGRMIASGATEQDMKNYWTGVHSSFEKKTNAYKGVQLRQDLMGVQDAYGDYLPSAPEIKASDWQRNQWAVFGIDPNSEIDEKYFGGDIGQLIQNGGQTLYDPVTMKPYGTSYDDAMDQLSSYRDFIGYDPNNSENYLPFQAVTEVFDMLSETIKPKDLTTKIAELKERNEQIPQEYLNLYGFYMDYMGKQILQDPSKLGMENGLYRDLMDENGNYFDTHALTGYNEKLQEAFGGIELTPPILPFDGVINQGILDVTALWENISSVWGSPVLHVGLSLPSIPNGFGPPGSIFDSSGGVANGKKPPGRLFADGGRATEASIFGEAGAEWAIPEEHTNRTAGLLLQAARASGYSMSELAEREGGLSATPGYQRQSPVFAPQIYVSGNDDGIQEAIQDAMRVAFEEFKQYTEGLKRDEERMAYT